jgi:hypothetical protein
MSSNCMLMVECGTVLVVVVGQFKMFMIWIKINFAKSIFKPTLVLSWPLVRSCSKNYTWYGPQFCYGFVIRTIGYMEWFLKLTKLLNGVVYIRNHGRQPLLKEMSGTVHIKSIAFVVLFLKLVVYNNCPLRLYMF